MKPHWEIAFGPSATLLLCALVAASGSALQAEEDHHLTLTVDQVEWKPGPPTLPAGAELAVLHGNPRRGSSSSG
jgi:hypothetical protein